MNIDINNIAKRENQLVIAFCGPSTCGKSTVLKELLKEYLHQSHLISSVNLDTFFYKTDNLPRTEFHGKMIPNKDLKQSVDWENFFKSVSQVEAPILFIDGFITFADQRSFNIIDVCVEFEYDFEKDFEVALLRRIRRKKSFENAEIPKNYSMNPFENMLNYRCCYFKEIVWCEMMKHPEYRKPLKWEKPILTLSATNDLQQNVQEAKKFVHPFIDSHFKINKYFI